MYVQESYLQSFIICTHYISTDKGLGIFYYIITNSLLYYRQQIIWKENLFIVNQS